MAEIKKRLKKNGKPSYTVCIRLKDCPPRYATFSRLTDAREWANGKESSLKSERQDKQLNKNMANIEQIQRKRIRSLRHFFQEIKKSENHLFEVEECEWWEDKWFKDECPLIDCSVCLSKQALYLDSELKKQQNSNNSITESDTISLEEELQEFIENSDNNELVGLASTLRCLLLEQRGEAFDND